MLVSDFVSEFSFDLVIFLDQPVFICLAVIYLAFESNLI